MQESRCTEFEKRGVVDDEKSCPAEIAPYEWLVGETRIIFLFVRIMPITASPRGRMNRRRCSRVLINLLERQDYHAIDQKKKKKKRKRKRKKRKYQREIDSLLASLTGRFRVHPEREGEREEDKEREEQYGTVARNPRPFPLFLL